MIRAPIGFFLRKIKYHFSRTIPYYLPKIADQELKDIWIRGLFNLPQYLFLHLFTLFLWKPYAFYHLKLNRKSRLFELNEKTDGKLLTLGIHERIPMFYFFYYGMSSDQIWNNRHYYLYHATLNHVFNILNKTDQVQLVSNKLSFNRICLELNIRTPVIYGIAEESGLNVFSEEPWQKNKNFVIKPIEGSKGRGFERFLFQGDKHGYSSSITEEVIPITEVSSYIKSKEDVKNGSYLIQEYINNHISFTPFCNGSLTVIRILTVLKEDGGISMFRPIIQFPQGDQAMAYLHKGAVVAKIDMLSGKMGVVLGAFNTHEDLVNKINRSDLLIPYWENVLESITKLHLKLNQIAVIGWDIAVSPNGPLIIEGNSSPSLDIHQLEPYGPFIGTDFYNLFLNHVKKTK